MDVLHERCAGLDISKKDVKVCIRTPSTKRRGSFTTETTTWGSTTNALLDLRDHLLAARVTLIVIEATSDYWKPFHYVLSEGLNVILVNARQVKNLPGRKTDVSDAAWLAQLGAHGLVRPSFVPPELVRELRDRGWRNCWRTPASNSLRSPPTSWASPAGPCSKPSSATKATRTPSRRWPNASSATRSPNSPRP